MQHNESPVDVTVSGLFSYPVKGCRGTAHANARILATGLLHDRQWMVVDARSSPAQFLSQRECPHMATINVEAMLAGGLRLSSDNGDTIDVAAPTNGLPLKVRVWNHETVAQDAGDPAAQWLGQHLDPGTSHVRLVRFHPDMQRDCNATYAGDSGAHTFFADGFPLLITSTSSLDDLNQRMRRSPANAMPMNRFRPNLVLSGLPAWDEDHIDTLSIGDVVLRLAKPCVRCQVTTTDQTSGSRLSEEPLVTLARFRNNPDFGGVTFGWNAVVLKGGHVSTGQPVEANYRF